MKKVLVLLAMALGASIVYAQSEPIQSIDLGLSIRWANMNVGAINPKDPGGYYASRETRIKTGYGNYNWFPESDPSKADVALTKWKYWRMPTQAEIDELLGKCSLNVYKDSDGKMYCKVTGPNGNHIILPLAGYYEDYGHESWLTRYNGQGNANFTYNRDENRFHTRDNGDMGGTRPFYGSMVRAVTPHKITNQEPIVEHVEDLPKYGDRGEHTIYTYWMRDYRKNRTYPPFAQENGIEGVVVVSFTVETDGSITDVKVEKSVHQSLDEDAVRMIKKMPKWNPGGKNGHVEPVRYTLPIKYDIEEFYQ